VVCLGRHGNAAGVTDVQLEVNPDVGTELEQTVTSLAQRVHTTLAIRDAVDLEQAVSDRQQIGAAIARVEEFFEPLTKAAYNAHKLLTTRRRDVLAPLQRVDGQLSAAISEFKSQQDAERAARERQLSEQARREQQQHAVDEAAQLEQQGQPEMADAVLEESLNAPAPVIVVEDVTEGLVKFRTSWHWRYAGGPNDVARTPAAVIARCMSMIPREFLALDTKKLSAYATAMKAAARVVGIEFYKVETPLR
jgi:hypothetical protein